MGNGKKGCEISGGGGSAASPTLLGKDKLSVQNRIVCANSVPQNQDFLNYSGVYFNAAGSDPGETN
jgi:hypothetical protein